MSAAHQNEPRTLAEMHAAHLARQRRMEGAKRAPFEAQLTGAKANARPAAAQRNTGVRTWSDAMDLRLGALWNEGLSATQVAATLSAEFPDHVVNRNAVLGRLHRLGLGGRRHPIAPKRATRPRRAEPANETAQPKPAPEHAPVITENERANAFADRPGSVSLLNLRFGMCRWPLDAEDGSTRFCAEDVTEKLTSYCPHHRALSFSRGTSSERKAHQPSGAAA